MVMKLFWLRFFLFFVISAVGCLIDLGTKSWIFAKLRIPDHENENVWWIWQNVFGFQITLNGGALFGIGHGFVTLFAAFSVIAILGITVWMFFQGAKSWFMTVVFGMLTAGVLGNLYDRLGLHGLHWENGEPVYAVRDWILLMIGTFPWPNFNIADSFLVVGAILLTIHVLLFTEQKSEQPKTEVKE
ncbi:MAG: signal peptidase II [Planctomycetaceae bacterium]|nr:signal peptidase II [Planctomycetaceae bacterium]